MMSTRDPRRRSGERPAKRRPRFLVLALASGLWLLYVDLLVSVPGCSDPAGATLADAAVDGAFDSADIDGASSVDAAPSLDSAPPEDATVVDGAADSSDDADGADAGDDVGAGDALSDVAIVDAADADPGDAALTEELVSPAHCPWGLAVTQGSVFWTETPNGIDCGAPAVRSCATTKCATLPPAIYTGTAGQSLPFGIAVPTATGPVFYTDNQAQANNRLWRLELDGGRTAWSSSHAGPAGATSDGTFVFWGSSSGATRTTIADAGAILLFAGNMSGSVDNGPQTIAEDGVRVFGAIDGNQVRVCDKIGNCNDGGATLVGTDIAEAGPAQIGGLVSDGTHVFFTSGMPYYTTAGVERLLRCPVAGCASGVPELLHQRATSNNAGGSHFGIAVDASHVYFGTVAGTIEYCPKGAAPCSPTLLVPNAKPFGFAVDGPYLYWADWRGGIYRVMRP